MAEFRHGSWRQFEQINPYRKSLYAGSVAQIILLLTGAMAIVSYWQINRDPYFAGFGALLIVVLPFLLFDKTCSILPP